MNRPTSVAAVVVTYNRLDKLKKVLAALEKQTVLPSSIIVVNNASTDGTDVFLNGYRGSSAISKRCNIKIINMENNIGGAGGFSIGMKEGYLSGADYVWVFDDDGYPEPDALEKLLNGFSAAVRELGPDVPYACSVVMFTDGSICEMNNPVPTWDWGRLLVKGQNSVMTTSCSFVSVLFPKWVIEKYGLPYKEYFIWFDDSEYTTRITKVCPGVQVLDSVIIHDMGSNKGVNFSMIDDHNSWKFAFGIRNQASYRLHHEGFIKYAIFYGTVIRAMNRGKVRGRLRVKMVGKMLEAIKFNPKIEFPTNQ